MSVPSPVNESLLSQGLGALGSARSWASNVLPELERFIRTANDYDLFSRQPHPIRQPRRPVRGGRDRTVRARRQSGPVRDGLAAHLRLCPQVAGSFRELDQVHPRFQCAFCNAINDVALDNYIQVTFTVSSGVRDIIFRHPEMLSVEDFYLRYNFSKGFLAPHGMTHQQLVAALSRGFADIEAHEHRSLDFEATVGRFRAGPASLGVLPAPHPRSFRGRGRSRRCRP